MHAHHNQIAVSLQELQKLLDHPGEYRHQAGADLVADAVDSKAHDVKLIVKRRAQLDLLVSEHATKRLVLVCKLAQPVRALSQHHAQLTCAGVEQVLRVVGQQGGVFDLRESVGHISQQLLVGAQIACSIRELDIHVLQGLDSRTAARARSTNAPVERIKRTIHNIDRRAGHLSSKAKPLDHAS